MAFLPSNFWANANKKLGFAKSNRFIVTIPIPSVIEFDNDTTRSLELQCENAELPGKTIAVQDVKVYGPSFKMATHKQYTNEISLTFLCTNTGIERQIFDDWIEYITPDQTNNMRFPGGIDGFSGSYWSNIVITQYNEYDELNFLYQQSQNAPKIYYREPEEGEQFQPESFSDAKGHPASATNQVELYQCFPIGYAAQPLNWGDDAFQKLVVQFSYRNFKNTF
jgi:hypothetical protein